MDKKEKKKSKGLLSHDELRLFRHLSQEGCTNAGRRCGQSSAAGILMGFSPLYVIFM